MAAPRRDSILAIDFGSVHTRVSLFDIVDGKYALVAHRQGKTTIGAPTDDARVGLARILREIASATDRRFFDDQGELIKPEQTDRVGVDYCITTASAGTPIRTVFVGLLPEKSIFPARRAASSFYIDAVAEIHLSDGMSEMARLNRIVDSRPDLIFISGGTDGGGRVAMLGMLGLAQQAVGAMPASARPTILYAGNKDLIESARDMLGQMVEVMTTNNISPSANRIVIEPAQAILRRFYDEFRRRRGSSFQNIAPMSDTGILPTARNFEMMTAFFARTTEATVLAIDVGGAKSMLSLAHGNQVISAMRTEFGMGPGATSMVESAGEDAIKSWLPFLPHKGELAQYALKKGLRSVNAPLDMRERYIDFALFRVAVGFMLEQLQVDCDNAATRIDLSNIGLVCIAGATITDSGHGALDMMLLADALPIKGVTQVMADRYGVLPALGALASIAPSAVVQLLEDGVVENVGSIVKATGRLASGKRALRLDVRMPDGERLARELASGDIWHLPLSAGNVVDARIQTARGVDVGDKRRLRLQVAGGRGGVLFDARLTTTPAGETITERAVNMLRWFAAATGDDRPVMIPESWLASPEAQDPQEPDLSWAKPSYFTAPSLTAQRIEFTK